MSGSDDVKEQLNIIQLFLSFLEQNIEDEFQDGYKVHLKVENAIMILSNSSRNQMEDDQTNLKQKTQMETQTDTDYDTQSQLITPDILKYPMMRWYFEEVPFQCTNKEIEDQFINNAKNRIGMFVSDNCIIPDTNTVIKIFREEVLKPCLRKHNGKYAISAVNKVINSAFESSKTRNKDSVDSGIVVQLTGRKIQEEDIDFDDLMKGILPRYDLFLISQKELVQYITSFPSFESSKPYDQMCRYYTNMKIESPRRSLMKKEQVSRLRRMFDGWRIKLPQPIQNLIALNKNNINKLCQRLKDKYAINAKWTVECTDWISSWIESLLDYQYKNYCPKRSGKELQTMLLQRKFTDMCIFKAFYDKCINWNGISFTINELLEISDGKYSHHIPYSCDIEDYKSQTKKFLEYTFSSPNNDCWKNFSTILGWTPSTSKTPNPNILEVSCALIAIDSSLSVHNFTIACNYIRYINNSIVKGWLDSLYDEGSIKKNCDGLFQVGHNFDETRIMKIFERPLCISHLTRYDLSIVVSKGHKLRIGDWLDCNTDRMTSNTKNASSSDFSSTTTVDTESKKRKLEEIQDRPYQYDVLLKRHDQLYDKLSYCCEMSVTNPTLLVKELQLMQSNFLKTGNFM